MNDNDRLNSLHTTTADGLDRLLDVEAGLREALVAAQHTRTRDNLDLDIEAGLGAIVPEGETPTPPTPAPAQPTGAEQFVVATKNPPYGSVTSWLRSLGDEGRLTMRQHPVVTAHMLTLQIVSVAANARATDRADGALGSALDRAYNRALVLHAELSRDRNPNHLRDRNLAIAIVGALRSGRASLQLGADGLDLVLDRARHFARDLAHHLARALDLDLDFAFDRDIASAVAGDAALGRYLDLARHDFTTADLSRAALSRVSLIGIRWSMATIWPSDEWRAQALLNSRDLGDGVYQIQDGNTMVPSHSAPG